MKRAALFVLLSLSASTLSSKVILPEILSDNMVLQQKTDVTLWGKAKANTSVSINTSWSKNVVKVKSDESGEWKAKIATPEASLDVQSVTISDGEKTVLNNILIGEVWFCSGQSNMEMPMRGFTNCPIEGSNTEIAKANTNVKIRCVTIPRVEAATPQSEVAGKWQVSNPENTSWFSATGYFFAKFLSETLDVPVGIINCSWGGSTVEGWLPESIVKNYPDIDLKKTNYEYTFMKPMIMYNGMLKPLQNYTIKGFLWYQGESNVGKHDTYAARLNTMVDLWRKEWGLGELPFYYVEIAPYDYGNNINGALLREAQYKAQKSITKSGMVCTNDLVQEYEDINIHPKNKKNIGERLACMALNKTYDINAIRMKGPEYKSMEIKEGKVVLTFENVEEGFNRLKDMVGFEIAGQDKVFYPADAKVTQHTKISVSSISVDKPVAVRYCFKNFVIGNVSNTAELPLVPFRTDNW